MNIKDILDVYIG